MLFKGFYTDNFGSFKGKIPVKFFRPSKINPIFLENVDNYKKNPRSIELNIDKVIEKADKKHKRDKRDKFNGIHNPYLK